MPGIITHKKILLDSITLLSRRKKKNYLQRSALSLFQETSQMKAAHFGCLGPNIFDYHPTQRRHGAYGNPVSFHLHDGGASDLLNTMISRIYGRKDRITEWTILQRSYLYGFASHMIADAFFHPFILFWSGFPGDGSHQEYARFREQNLLFAYNLDNYYQYYSYDGIGINFDLMDFLPLKKSSGHVTIYAPIKSLILESLREIYPDIYSKIIFYPRHGREKDPLDTFGVVDLIPREMRFSYWLKRTDNPQVTETIAALKRRRFPYTDYLVRYPSARKLNRHVLNFHQDRWQYPAGKPGFLYSSVDHLVQNACEAVADCWEILEEGMYSESVPEIPEILRLNSYTGEKHSFREMIHSNPVRLHF